MRHGSLFSGIGGFDLAAEWMGWENVFHCENNSFCQKILKHYWPDATSYGDIEKTDFTNWNGNVDIVSGGFPCQPYSTAGKRKGKEDDRHLWPQMLRAIREIQPRWIVGENVSGLLNWNRGMVLDEIKADLEAAGFEVFPPLVLPACGKNAPHRRDRVWLIAYSQVNSFNNENRNERYEPQEVQEKRFDEPFVTANTESLRVNREAELENNKRQSGERRGCDTNNDGEIHDKNRSSINPNSNNQGLQRSKVNGGVGEVGQKRNEQFAGHIPPTWEKFPTQSPICGGNDGFPNRVDRIKALGNAIVPQVAYEIFKAIEQISE